MSGFFDQYLPRPSEVSQRNTAAQSIPTAITEPAELVNPVEVVTSSEPTNSNLIDATQNLETRKGGKIELWETKVKKTVHSHKLVWAPYYLCHNKLFCARLCEKDEAERCLFIPIPILEQECVVEFICCPKTKARDSQLLKVHKNKLVPFYGNKSTSDADNTPKDKWNESLMKKLQVVSTIR